MAKGQSSCWMIRKFSVLEKCWKLTVLWWLPKCLVTLRKAGRRLDPSVNYGPQVFLTAHFPTCPWTATSLRSSRLQAWHKELGNFLPFILASLSPGHYFNGIPLYLWIQMYLKANKTFKGRSFFQSKVGGVGGAGEWELLCWDLWIVTSPESGESKNKGFS